MNFQLIKVATSALKEGTIPKIHPLKWDRRYGTEDEFSGTVPLAIRY